jgi:hypothetical protein
MAGRALKVEARPVGDGRGDCTMGCVSHRMVEVRDLAGGAVVVRRRLRNRMRQIGRRRPRRMCAVKLVDSCFPRVLAVHNIGIAIVDGGRVYWAAVNGH